jgi:hypothetical protein
MDANGLIESKPMDASEWLELVQYHVIKEMATS